MAKKTVIEISLFSDVAAGATETEVAPIVPNGRVLRVTSFGGTAPMDSSSEKECVFVLQWGSGSSWDLVRAYPNKFDVQLFREFTGDGIKRLRVLRLNRTTTTKPMACWLEGLLL